MVSGVLLRFGDKAPTGICSPLMCFPQVSKPCKGGRRKFSVVDLFYSVEARYRMSPSGADAGMHVTHVRMVAADNARFQFHTEHHADV